MRFILEERELLNLRKILISMVIKRYIEHVELFLSLEDYKEWAFEIVDEGLAVALQAEDWRPELRKDENPDSLRGLQVWYIFMKCRPIADKSLRQEQRYRRAFHEAMVREQIPPYQTSQEFGVSHVDLERALPLLSADQGAAISLVYFAQVSIDQAAKILKRSRGAMDMLLSRARKRLGELMENPHLFDNVPQQRLDVAKNQPERVAKERSWRDQGQPQSYRRLQNES